MQLKHFMNMKKNRLKLFVFAIITGILYNLAGISYASNLFDKKTIAIYPFENYSGDKAALKTIYPLVENKLKNKNYNVLDSETLKRFLLKERIRDKGYIDFETSKKLINELNIDLVITGSINTFTIIDNPQVGLCLRIIDLSTNSIIWAEHGAITNNDFQNIFGHVIKKDLNELSSILIERLFKSLNKNEITENRKKLYRVAIMPFSNKTQRKELGMIATNIFIEKLFKNTDIEPVELGNTRKIIVEQRILQKGEIDFKNVEKISEALNVDGIIVGNVESYKNDFSADQIPEVEVSARLLETRTKKITWSGFSHFKGDEKIIILDWGKIRSPEAVLSEALGRLATDLSKKTKTLLGYKISNE